MDEDYLRIREEYYLRTQATAEVFKALLLSDPTSVEELPFLLDSLLGKIEGYCLGIHGPEAAKIPLYDPTFFGGEPLGEMLETGEVVPGVIVRLREGGLKDDDFMVTPHGLEIMTHSEPPYVPDKVLSRDYSPNGWTIVEW